MRCARVGDSNSPLPSAERGLDTITKQAKVKQLLDDYHSSDHNCFGVTFIFFADGKWTTRQAAIHGDNLHVVHVDGQEDWSGSGP